MLVAAGAAHAQGSIEDSPATFSLNADHFIDASADLLGVTSELESDFLFSEGWWYRLAGDESESFFPEPDGQTYTGAVATLSWDDVNGRGAFSAVETDTIVNTGGPSARVTLSLAITNLSSTDPLAIDVFHMADVDVAGSENDSAILAAPRLIRITDGSNSVEYLGSEASAYLVTPSGASDVATVLFDAAADEFRNTGLPFDAGDVTAGFQWSTIVIPPSGVEIFTAVIAANTTAIPGTVTTSTTSSTSVTAVSTTTSTTSPALREACGDCLDNDADGFVDFEDPDCCVLRESAPIGLSRGKLKARGTGSAGVTLVATLPQSVLPSAPITDDLTLQIRAGGQEPLCARVPGASFRQRKSKLIFSDPGASVASARGFDPVVIVLGKKGKGRLIARGKMMPLELPDPGPLTLTFGLRNPATAEATNRCAAGTGQFASKRKGLVLR